MYTTIGLAVGGASALLYALEQSVKAYDWPLHPPAYNWSHSGVLDAYDHARCLFKISYRKFY